MCEFVPYLYSNFSILEHFFTLSYAFLLIFVHLVAYYIFRIEIQFAPHSISSDDPGFVHYF